MKVNLVVELFEHISEWFEAHIIKLSKIFETSAPLLNMLSNKSRDGKVSHDIKSFDTQWI